MKYGDYILRLWNGAGEASTLYYITPEDAKRCVRAWSGPAALLVRDIHGKQSVVFAYSRNF